MAKTSARHENDSDVRNDAWKAFAVTMAMHLGLIALLTLVVADRIASQPLQLIVQAKGENVAQSEQDKSEARESEANRQPENRRSIEYPRPQAWQVPLAQMGIDPATSIEFPIKQLSLETLSKGDLSPKTDSSPTESKQEGPKEEETNAAAEIIAVGERRTGWTGIEITMDPNYEVPRLVQVLIGGPAHIQRSLRRTHNGDFLRTVDGKPTTSLKIAQVRDLIVGEVGTVVRLGFSRTPKSSIAEYEVRRGLLPTVR